MYCNKTKEIITQDLTHIIIPLLQEVKVTNDAVNDKDVNNGRQKKTGNEDIQNPGDEDIEKSGDENEEFSEGDNDSGDPDSGMVETT